MIPGHALPRAGDSWPAYLSGRKWKEHDRMSGQPCPICQVGPPSWRRVGTLRMRGSSLRGAGLPANGGRTAVAGQVLAWDDRLLAG